VTITGFPKTAGAGDDRLTVTYAGEGAPLFWLVARGLALTFLTLGIYRFWMKARVRRYYWSSVRLGGQPFEFTGTGLEMFLGFLIAVVFLAVYLGIFNLLLAFLGMALLENPLALNLTILAIVPLIYYASYRARRYRLSRTRWRGIRFGMMPGAVDYMVRALGYALVAIVTLGLMVPWMDFRLRKFAMDRTFFGDLRFTQGGSWTGLLKPWLWVMGSGLLIAVGLAGIAAGAPVLVAVLVIGYLALVLALVHYSVAGLRYSVQNTTLGETVRLGSEMRTGHIVGIYIIGGILLAVIATVAAIVLGLLGAGLLYATGAWSAIEGAFSPETSGYIPQSVQIASLLGFALYYVLLILIVGAFAEVLITQPVLRHYAETAWLSGAAELDRVVQRPQDRMAEAEGFADALDVGAAF
jgi:uncharacterized membrane protein YjgN (DUF898 family)